MRVVLDSSAALTWCLPGQGGLISDTLLRRIRIDGAIVPSIWHLEVANILGLKLRDGNLTELQIQDALMLLRSLNIATDKQQLSLSISASIGQMIRFQLAAYDAIYIELALRTGSPLATFDKAMIVSARRHGLTLIGSV